MSRCRISFGRSTVTAQVADWLKTLGVHYATRSGISFAISDIKVPPAKHAILSAADAEAAEVEETYRAGMITAEERYRQLIEVWTRATEAISTKLEAELDQWGSLATIITSGATKAKFQQIRQLSGMRGLMANPSGDIIAVPVRGNYLEGLKVWELFIAASGARKGFMDRSLNTARSGYLTRKLVEVGLEVWITAEECGTTQGLLITHEESKRMGLPSMRDRLLGRVLAEPLPEMGLDRGTLLSKEAVDRLLATSITAVRVRSPLTCQAPYGICQRCYGIDLATGHLVRRGTAVGIIAAQSIGEPGTQLTMSTFHSGGIANAQGDITQGLPRVEELFEVRAPKHRAVISEIDGVVESKGMRQQACDAFVWSLGKNAAAQIRPYQATSAATRRARNESIPFLPVKSCWSRMGRRSALVRRSSPGRWIHGTSSVRLGAMPLRATW